MTEMDMQELLKTQSKEKWERIGLDKRSGALVPLFSVYSQKSLGVGDLRDLKLLIDWCEKTGNSILQLLPMNEVGPIFCPYDSVSSFALEPMYLTLSDIPGAKTESVKSKISRIKKSFPVGKPHVDYRIKDVKMHLLWEIYNAEKDPNSEELMRFMERNEYWLDDYALFNVLKYYNKGLAWYDWEPGYKERDPVILGTFRREHAKEILFQKWVQWQLYNQFREVKLYAQAKNVLLKGDLPILVSQDSADVWAHPEFFKLEFVAGAPADMYCAKGQRWGTPTYNWDKIFGVGGRYVVEKLRFAENFYDILRIDHVVGLFRIWSIPQNEPLENKGLNGFFDPKEENKWEGHGKKILLFIIYNTNMLLCAEDLGIIPQVCPKTLKEFGVPGNDVQRWVKDWNVTHDFLSPEKYRSLSVTMLSTHDTTNWPAWWENEAGTVDEGLFIRRCLSRGIDYNVVKDKLFNPKTSRHGRLRWLNSINSVDKLIALLGKKKDELKDFIDMYENSFQEKEKLWRILKLEGKMREKSDKEIVKSVLRFSLDSSSVFSIHLITDWLYLTDIFKKGPYTYRINTPGTVSLQNWSLVMPISLEELLENKVCLEIRKMIEASGRLWKN